MFGRRCRIPASRFGWIHPDLAQSWHFGQIRLDKWPDPVKFGQIRPDKWPDPVKFGQIPAILAKSSLINGWIQPESVRFRPEINGWNWSVGRDDGDRLSQDSGADRILVAGCCRIPMLARFQQLTIVEFRQSDIKCEYKDEEFNFVKRFTVLETVNCFPKIKEAFTIKLKMISVNYYFCPYQTP